MSGIMSMLLGAVSSAAAAVDEFFNRVTLLLPGNGTNGAQNNTFLDSSTNNFTITRNGNTTQGTFSPFSQTGWSNYFNSATPDWLSIANNAAFDLGTGDCTIEAWIYTNSLSGTQAIFSVFPASGTISGYTMQIYTSGFLGVDSWVSGNNQVITANNNAVTVGSWFHVAYTRSGGTNRLFVNGNLCTTSTNTLTQALNSGGNTEKIGYQGYAGFLHPFNGYISNLRVLKGTAQYTAAFTPSTTPLTNITNTSLLTCQSNRFIDNSTNAFALTVNGTPSIQAFSPFAPTAAYSAATVGGSGYFDGTGDYLVSPSNTALAMGTGDFTWECWVYFPSAASYRQIFSTRPATGASSAQGSMAINPSNGLSWYTSGFIVDYTTSIGVNQWVHVAVCRSGTSLRVFANGTQVGSTATNSDNLTGNVFSVGANNDGSETFTGYISGVRVLKGTALYTSSTYTIPTAPLTAITNTSILLNYTNAGITDATAKNDLETVGNAQISTTQSKFGGSSISFDGTGDYLTFPASQNWVFGTGDFTIEFWLYANSLASTAVLVECRNNTVGIVIFYDSGALRVNFNSVGGTLITGGSLSTATWHHIALSRSGSSTRLFINGTQSGSTATDTNNYSNNTLVIAASYLFTQTLNGYIDDLRISKYARYTANFTAPTTAFPLQ